MERFSPAARASNPGDKGFDQVEEELARVIALRVEFFDGLDLSPVSKIPFKFYALLQIGLRRTVELTEACMREINRGNMSSMCVLSRSVLETAALLYDTMHRVRASVEDPKKFPLEDLDQHLVTVFMGGKSDDWRINEEHIAKNIITILDRLKKQMPDSNLRWFYDGLSEHAHPNYHGMYGTYVGDSRDQPQSIAVFSDGNPGRVAIVMVLALSGLSLALVMVEGAIKQELEFRKSFARLCEKGIYESGKWPQGLDYPVKR